MRATAFRIDSRVPIADFTLAALSDSGGFTLSWTVLDDPDGAGGVAATQGMHLRSYSAGGVAQDLAPAIFHAPEDATNMATTGLIGDRVIAVFQHNATPGDAGNIGAQIFDTRVDAIGDPILLNGPGITMIGDPDFETRGRTAPDVLVGTIGRDTVDGRQADDILDGGLGDDTIAGRAATTPSMASPTTTTSSPQKATASSRSPTCAPTAMVQTSCAAWSCSSSAPAH